MLFALICHDAENGGLEARKATREAHLAYLKDAGDRLKIAGPLLTAETGGQPKGSLIIIDAASEGAAQLFAKNDPYNAAGVFDSVDIVPFKYVTGGWGEKAD